MEAHLVVTADDIEGVTDSHWVSSCILVPTEVFSDTVTSSTTTAVTVAVAANASFAPRLPPEAFVHFHAGIRF